MDRPIGMFDSGFGGLTVARATIDLLPAEDLVYIGDTGRYPYGSKPLDDVRQYAHELAWSPRDGLRRQGDRRCVQHRHRGRARRSPRRAARPDHRRHRPGCPRPGAHDGHRSGRRDRHRRHDGLGRLPACRRRDGCARVVDERGVPWASWSSSSAARPAATRSWCSPNGSSPRSVMPTSMRCCWAAPTTRSSPARSAT